MLWIYIGIFWLICAIITHGFTFANLQRYIPSLADTDRLVDLRRSILLSLLGPGALIAALIYCLSAKSGFLLYRKHGGKL